MVEVEVDLEKYLESLKNQGVNVTEVEDHLERLIISSSVLEQPREVQ